MWMFVSSSPHHKKSKAGEELLVRGPCGVKTFQPALWGADSAFCGEMETGHRRRNTHLIV